MSTTPAARALDASLDRAELADAASRRSTLELLTEVLETEARVAALAEHGQALRSELLERGRAYQATEGMVPTWRAPIGQVILSDPKPKIGVADREAFTAWVATEHPDQVTATIRLDLDELGLVLAACTAAEIAPPAVDFEADSVWEKAFLKGCAVEGSDVFAPETGAAVDGVALLPAGRPTLSVRPDAEVKARLIAEVRASVLAGLTPASDALTCRVCGEPTGGEHGTPAMAHPCTYPGCVFGPDHSAGYHLVDGQRIPVPDPNVPPPAVMDLPPALAVTPPEDLVVDPAEGVVRDASVPAEAVPAVVWETTPAPGATPSLDAALAAADATVEEALAEHDDAGAEPDYADAPVASADEGPRWHAVQMFRDPQLSFHLHSNSVDRLQVRAQELALPLPWPTERAALAAALLTRVAELAEGAGEGA